MLRFLLILTLNLFTLMLVGQTLTIDGYIYETGNRGFLNVVKVDVQDTQGKSLGTTFTDLTGHFQIEVPARINYKVVTTKDMFLDLDSTLSAGDKGGDGNKLFMKIEMRRAPGYIFEITLAENREDEAIPVDAIKGARIEVYNNTTSKEILALVDHPEPHFDVALLKGNHYTILVRKEGYLSKRMEAFVDVEGCILCFEGIGSVGPGVSDNLSQGNEMGVLLANVELEKIYDGKTLPINNIIYEYTKADLNKNDQNGLLALATLMSDNPDLTVEIGSHTDSRGQQHKNMELSQKRAKNVVDFLVDHNVDKSRLYSRGYGETQLKNKCTSFIECTEAEHRINRRTELKVLGIAAVKAPIKTLAQIKQMENAEKLLEEIQFGGQMKVPGDEDTKETATESEDVKVIEDVIEQEIETPVKNPVSNIEENLSETAASEVVETIVEETVSEEEIVTEKEIVTEEAVVLPILKAQSVSYAISIAEGLEPLADDDVLFSRHSNLSKMEQGDMHIYTIGNFTNVKEAQAFFKTVKLAYPDAKMIKLVDEMVVE